MSENTTLALIFVVLKFLSSIADLIVLFSSSIDAVIVTPIVPFVHFCLRHSFQIALSVFEISIMLGFIENNFFDCSCSSSFNRDFNIFSTSGSYVSRTLSILLTIIFLLFLLILFRLDSKQDMVVLLERGV